MVLITIIIIVTIQIIIMKKLEKKREEKRKKEEKERPLSKKEEYEQLKYKITVEHIKAGQYKLEKGEDGYDIKKINGRIVKNRVYRPNKLIINKDIEYEFNYRWGDEYDCDAIMNGNPICIHKITKLGIYGKKIVECLREKEKYSINEYFQREKDEENERIIKEQLKEDMKYAEKIKLLQGIEKPKTKHFEEQIKDAQEILAIGKNIHKQTQRIQQLRNKVYD